MKRPKRKKSKPKNLIPAFRGILRAKATGSVTRGGQANVSLISTIEIDETKVTLIKEEGRNDG